MTTFILLCVVAFGGKPDPIFNDIAVNTAKPADNEMVASSVTTNKSLTPRYVPKGNSLPPSDDPAFTRLNQQIAEISISPIKKGQKIFVDDRFLKNKDEWEISSFNLEFIWKKHGSDNITVVVSWAGNNEGKIFYSRAKVSNLEDIENPSSLQFKSVDSPATLMVEPNDIIVFGKQNAFAALNFQTIKGKALLIVKCALWWRWGFYPYHPPAHVRTKNHSDFRR